MHIRLLKIIIIFVATNCDLTCSAEDVVFTIPEFHKLTESELVSVSKSLEQSHREVVSALELQLRGDACTPPQRARIMLLLADLGEGASEIVKYVDLRSPPAPDRFRPPLWDEYPAKTALVRLGRSGISAVLLALRTESVALRRKLMLDVIEDSEGKAIGLLRFDEAIDRIDREMRAKGGDLDKLTEGKQKLLIARKEFGSRP